MILYNTGPLKHIVSWGEHFLYLVSPHQEQDVLSWNDPWTSKRSALTGLMQLFHKLKPSINFFFQLKNVVVSLVLPCWWAVCVRCPLRGLQFHTEACGCLPEQTWNATKCQFSEEEAYLFIVCRTLLSWRHTFVYCLRSSHKTTFLSVETIQRNDQSLKATLFLVFYQILKVHCFFN